MSDLKSMQHVVLVNFPREVTSEESQWIDALLLRWPKEIGGIRSQHWGWDVSGRSQGYQWGLVMEFESEAAAARYQPHTLHQEFAQWVKQVGGQVLAFDFPLGEDEGP